MASTLGCSGGAPSFDDYLEESLYAVVSASAGVAFYKPLGPEPVVPQGTFDDSLLDHLEVVLESTSTQGTVTKLASFDAHTTPALVVKPTQAMYLVSVPAAPYFTNPSLTYRFRVLRDGVQIAESEMSTRIFTVLQYVPTVQVGVKVRIDVTDRLGVLVFGVPQPDDVGARFHGFADTCPIGANLAPFTYAPSSDRAIVDPTDMTKTFEWIVPPEAAVGPDALLCIPGRSSDAAALDGGAVYLYSTGAEPVWVTPRTGAYGDEAAVSSFALAGPYTDCSFYPSLAPVDPTACPGGGRGLFFRVRALDRTWIIYGARYDVLTAERVGSSQLTFPLPAYGGLTRDGVAVAALGDPVEHTGSAYYANMTYWTCSSDGNPTCTDEQRDLTHTNAGYRFLGCTTVRAGRWRCGWSGAGEFYVAHTVEWQTGSWFGAYPITSGSEIVLTGPFGAILRGDRCGVATLTVPSDATAILNGSVP